MRLANHYGSPTATGWYDGDFDYNGVGRPERPGAAVEQLRATLAGPAGPRPGLRGRLALAQELAAAGETGRAASGPAQAVPEPGALGLAGLAAAGALLARRRRR